MKWTPKDQSWADELAPYDTKAEMEALLYPAEGYRDSGVYVGNVRWRTGPYYADPFGGCKWIEDWFADTTNLHEVDPLFVDEAGGDYRLRAQSPAAKLDPAFPLNDWNKMIQIVGPQPRDP